MDRDVDWLDALARALRPGQAPARSGSGPRRLAIPERCAAAFGAVEGPHDVRFARRFTRDALVGLAGTYSAVITRPPAERAALLDELRGALQADPRFADPAGVEVPLISRCYRTRRLAPAAAGRQS
jgi:hypothetical protein